MKRLLTFGAVLFTASLFIMGCKASSGEDTEKKEETVEFKITQTLTTTPVLIDNGDGSLGPTAEYYYFGDYPQSKVAAENVPTEFATNPTENGWLVGNDGKLYAKSGDDYFAVEPIKWAAVKTDYDYDGSNTGTLLVSESILQGGVSFFYDNAEDYDIPSSERTEEKAIEYALSVDSKVRGINGKTVFSNNYKYSVLRAFLIGESYLDLNNQEVSTYKNAGFLQKAFSSTAAADLLTVTVQNGPDTAIDAVQPGISVIGITSTRKLSNDCEDTQDKVFVLSEYESTYPEFGGYGNDQCEKRVRTSTDYAIATGAVQYDESGDSTAPYASPISGYKYWLRTPYYKNGSTLRYISADGITYFRTKASDSAVGVVPAIVLAND